MKINWISPLPPAVSGIAYLTDYVADSLTERANVTFWGLGTEAGGSFKDRYNLNTWPDDHGSWQALNSSDITIYNIGNNLTYHAQIWKISRIHPGIVVLHDTHLQHLFAGLIAYSGGDREKYISIMRRFYGENGESSARALFAGSQNIFQLAATYPMTEYALERALGAVVHTRQAYDFLVSLHKWPVLYVPLAHPGEMSSGDAVKKRQMRGFNKLIRLVVFGHLNVNRRIDKIINALAKYPQRNLFRFDIIGTLEGYKNLDQTVRDQGLDKQVCFHGHLSDEGLDGLLEKSDIAINLRYPTMGEASLSQLRIWAHALPTLVTRTGWYAELPEGTVVYADVENEERDIHRFFDLAISKQEMLLEIGEKGNDCLKENHSPEGYAEAIINFSKEVACTASRGTAMDMAVSIEKKAMYWKYNECHIDCLKRAYRAIEALTGYN